MYWFCKEAAIDIQLNLELFHSAKLWMFVHAHYESVNPEAPNAKQFDQELYSRLTIIGEFPLTEETATTILNHIAKLYKNWPIVCFSFMRGL